LTHSLDIRNSPLVWAYVRLSSVLSDFRETGATLRLLPVVFPRAKGGHTAPVRLRHDPENFSAIDDDSAVEEFALESQGGANEQNRREINACLYDMGHLHASDVQQEVLMKEVFVGITGRRLTPETVPAPHSHRKRIGLTPKSAWY
jgi:hypothetical protein